VVVVVVAVVVVVVVVCDWRGLGLCMHACMEWWEEMKEGELVRSMLRQAPC